MIEINIIYEYKLAIQIHKGKKRVHATLNCGAYVVFNVQKQIKLIIFELFIQLIELSAFKNHNRMILQTRVRRVFSTLHQKILPQYNHIKLVHRGNKAHYQRIRQLYKTLREQNNKYYLYHKQPIDVGYEMLKRNVRVITYITKQNYETVEAIPNGKTDKKWEKIEQPTQQNLKSFLQNHTFEIHTSFLDLHPSESYHKMCMFMGVQKDEKIMDIFSNCKFSEHPIPKSTYILPFLKELNERYLNTKQLKLRKLDRIRKATKEQEVKSIQFWKSVYMLQWSSYTSKQENTWKKAFAVQSGLGEQVSLEQLLEGYGEKSFYATWSESDNRK